MNFFHILQEKHQPKAETIENDPDLENTPIYPCGVCGKEVNDNDEAILCEAGCTFWYHRSCTGMSKDAYAFMTNEDNAEWACDKCITTKSIPLVKLRDS